MLTAIKPLRVSEGFHLTEAQDNCYSHLFLWVSTHLNSRGNQSSSAMNLVITILVWRVFTLDKLSDLVPTMIP